MAISKYPFKEHEIVGQRQTEDISGTFKFDWNAYSQFVLTPTGAVTLGNDNLPVAPNTKVISGVFKASSFAVTFPASWVAREGNSALSSTKDTFFTAQTLADGTVDYTLDNGSGSGSGSSAGTVDDAIVDGVTTRAPSQNAVFDALALKVSTSVSYNSLGQLGPANDVNTAINGATKSGYWRISLNADTADKPANMPAGFKYASNAGYAYLYITYTGAASTVEARIIDVEGNIYTKINNNAWQRNGGRIVDNTSTASASNEGTFRYRKDANNSYVEMSMQTGATTYAWVIIKQNTW